MATAAVSNVSKAEFDEKVDYKTLALDMVYQLTKPEEATNFCISVSDVSEVISKVLCAADNHAKNPKPPAAVSAAAVDEEEEEASSYYSGPGGLTITRSISSGQPKSVLAELCRDLGAQFIDTGSLLTKIKLVLDFKDEWKHKFTALPRFVFNHPEGPRETPGMVLAAHDHNIPVHVSVIGYMFSLPFQGGMEATFYYLNPEYKHLPLPTIKAIFAAEKQEREMAREEHYRISSELSRIARQIDDEITKINPRYRCYNGRPFDSPSYEPPNEAIAKLYSEYKKIKEIFERPKPLDDCLGELKMPKFTLSSETDILNSPEFQSSPLYPMFTAGDSKVKKFLNILVKFTNKTTIAMNEEGAEAYSETDMDFMDRGLSDEPEPKNYIDINMNSSFWVELVHCNHYERVTTNYFTAKVVSP
jgi:hypothetical protein